MEDKYTVYKHTSPKGKVYIGITKRTPNQRWGKNGKGYHLNRNSHFCNAIAKYGWDNFEHEILYEGLNKKEAEKKEIELIAKYNATNPRYGYNISIGGGLMSKEQMAKAIETKRANGTIALNAKKTKELWANAEWRAKMIESQKGRKVTDLQRENYRNGAIKRAINNPLTQEAKLKISESAKKRVGEKSPHSIPIYQISCSTGEIVDSYINGREASKKNSFPVSSINQATRLRRIYRNHLWVKQSEYSKELVTELIREQTIKKKKQKKEAKKQHKKEISNKKPCICIETGERFESGREARRKYGDSVGECLRGKLKTSHGMHWQYI